MEAFENWGLLYKLTCGRSKYTWAIQILNEEKIQIIFCEKILVYPSSTIHTMREGVLYFQYVCGHDDLIKHKKGHSATKIKYIGTGIF